MITPPKPVQREFTFKLPSQRVLFTMDAAVALLGQDEDRIMNLIHEGHLLWAFDISRDGATQRREIRILRQSILDYAKEVEPSPDWRDQRKDAAQWERVMGLILPARDIRCSELKKRFWCSPTHILQLLEDGTLTPVPMPHRAPKESPIITRTSIVEFLRKRIV